MFRKNGLIRLANGETGKIISIKRFKTTMRSNGATFSQSGIDKLIVKTRNGKTVEVTDFKDVKTLVKSDLEISVYNALKALKDDDSDALERVWNRRYETEETFIDNDTFGQKKRFDGAKLRKLATEEGTTFKRFIAYAQKRSAEEQL